MNKSILILLILALSSISYSKDYNITYTNGINYLDPYKTYKFDWYGSPVALNNQSGTVPNTFKLNQNYPNLFNPSTSIEFGLPKGGNATLTIYDITGREVDKIINNVHLAAGTYKYSFNGSNLSSGIYFYRLQMNGLVVDVKKMMFIK